MIRALFRLGDIFEKKDSGGFILFGLIIFFNSVLEIIGVGLLLPFILLLSRPDIVTQNGMVSRFYHYFHFQSFSQMMIVLAVGLAVAFILKNVLVFFTSFWQTKFLLEKKISLKESLFRMYLKRPYAFHLQSNIARLEEKLELADVTNLLAQYFNILTDLILVIGFFSVLMWAQPIYTMAAFVLLGGILGLYFYFFKDKLHRWGLAGSWQRTYAWGYVNQGLGSMKEVKIFGKEGFFSDRYEFHQKNASSEEAKWEVLSKVPKMLIEPLVISFVMLAVIYSLWIGTSPDKIFVTLSVFAVVAIKLMPTLTRISSEWSTIKYYIPIFDKVYDDLMISKTVARIKRPSQGLVPMAFQKEIRLENIRFFYENCTKPALENVSMTIPKSAMVGFVGSSGAGKTTTIDIIAGLLNPSEGSVLVDGVDIQSNLRGWQDQIGYIPQAIYLNNDTIKANVAFGIEVKDIDDQKVLQALRLSQLDEFVAGLPEGLETMVGERGIRLSGGQRQRIGIARALYNDPEVLIMDEATAALDNETERAFMSSLAGLSGIKTILIIAHRLTTVRACDVIFFMKDGNVIGRGNYNELSEKCPDFQDMAGIGITIKV